MTGSNYSVLRQKYTDWGVLMSDQFFYTYDEAEDYANSLWDKEGVSSVICERTTKLEWQQTEAIPF